MHYTALAPIARVKSTGRRLTEPRSLDEDNLPTNLGAMPDLARSYGEEEPY